jgi:hypothetical protein
MPGRRCYVGDKANRRTGIERVRIPILRSVSATTCLLPAVGERDYLLPAGVTSIAVMTFWVPTIWKLAFTSAPG